MTPIQFLSQKINTQNSGFATFSNLREKSSMNAFEMKFYAGKIHRAYQKNTRCVSKNTPCLSKIHRLYQPSTSQKTALMPFKVILLLLAQKLCVSSNL